MTEQRQQRVDDRARQAEALARHRGAICRRCSKCRRASRPNAKLDPWLRAQGLEKLPRLFRKLVVEPGWETAFEAVLRERVQGVEVGKLDTIGGLARRLRHRRALLSIQPAMALPSDARSLPQMTGFRRLSELVRTHDAAFAAVLADWLANVFVADDLAVGTGGTQRIACWGAVCRPGGAPRVAARRALLTPPTIRLRVCSHADWRSTISSAKYALRG